MLAEAFQVPFDRLPNVLGRPWARLPLGHTRWQGRAGGKKPRPRLVPGRHGISSASIPTANDVAGQLVGAAIEALKGEVSDRAKLRDALKNAATQIRPPRGPIQFDRYQQVITSVYITRVERQGNRLVNAIVDRIPNTSQEETWKWWNK